jgi:hypothetical protein
MLRQSKKISPRVLSDEPTHQHAAVAQQEAEQPLSLDAIADDPRSRIAVVAYLMSERRGFAPGFELDDWLAAEAELSRNGSSRD